MTEIEIRGKLTKAQFTNLLELFSSNGQLLKSYTRLSVDLSPGFDVSLRAWPRGSDFDLRIKKSDQEEKISLKIGEFHLKERKEVDVKLKEGELLQTLDMFSILGLKEGMVYFWKSWEFIYKGFEVKLSKYTDDYYSWEIESKNSAHDPTSLANELDLTPYSEVTYREAIDWENQNVHQLYSMSIVQDRLKEF